MPSSTHCGMWGGANDRSRWSVLSKWWVHSDIHGCFSLFSAQAVPHCQLEHIHTSHQLHGTELQSPACRHKQAPLTPESSNSLLSIPLREPSLGPDTFSHLYRNLCGYLGLGHVELKRRVESSGKVRSLSPANDTVKPENSPPPPTVKPMLQ